MKKQMMSEVKGLMCDNSECDYVDMSVLRKDYLKYMQNLVKEGLLDPDLIGATYEQTSQRMAENKVGATFDYCMQMWLEPSVNAENPEFLPIANLETGYDSYNIIEPPFFILTRTDLDGIIIV